MIEESRFSLDRIIIIVGLIFIYFLGIGILISKNELLIDEVLCLVFVSVVFCIVFILTLVIKRIQGIYDGTNYKRILCMNILCWCILIGFSFRPGVFLPYMLIGIILHSVLDEGSSIGVSVYLAMIYAIIESVNMYFLYGYIVLAILGILYSSILKSDVKISKVYSFFFTFAMNFIVTVAFLYFAYMKLSKINLWIAVIESFIVTMAMNFLFSRIYRWMNRQKVISYEEILDPEYSLVVDIRRFSILEYNHALRVSKLARACTHEIRGKELTAACGGMYYRLGKIQGRPEIQNAIKLANNHCFPKDVISILTEYGGIVRRPQTPESAIVHMCDVIVTKMEALSTKESMQSNWNQDMVIYQTLNEFSQKGFYDESGLSMNQFLIVRERMIREESIV